MNIFRCFNGFVDSHTSRSLVVLVSIVMTLMCVASSTQALDVREILREQAVNREYRISLSALNKIDGDWESEKELKLTGKLLRTTYEFARGTALNDVEKFLRTNREGLNHDALDMHWQLLFDCKGLDCGSSNARANNQFQVKQLYGLDTTQRYRVWHGRVERGDIFRIEYWVERGNRRLYAQQDWLQTDNAVAAVVPSVSAIISQLQSQGYFILPQYVQDNTELIDALVLLLSKKPFWSLALVEHGLSAPGGVAKNAQNLLEVMSRRGAAIKKIQVFYAGFTSPRLGQKRERLEWVLLNR